ncbi:MAG: hypothetical protein IIV97_05560, partial [Oscillospiraceae bacterium]|nr:hypothetical protein [Oscillospiraceae bacterium]
MDIQKRTRRNEKWRTLADRIRKSIPKSPLAAMANLFSSFLLSRGVLLGAIAPFGLSASAAHHTGRFMLWRLLGAIAGYISVSGKINSLKYIACIILIFTAHFVFDGTSLSKKRGFVLLSAVIPTACINFVFLADSGFSLFDTAMYFLEIALVGLFAVSFSFIIKEGGSTKPEISFGLLSLSVGIISALCDVTIGGISLGRCLSLLFLLFCAFGGGVTGGAVCGTVFGFSLSLSLSCPEYALIYGTLGVLSSLFSSFGKYIFAAVGLLCFLPLTVILGQSTNPASTFEFLIAASLFLPFAEKVSFRMRTLFASSHKKSDLHTKRYVSERLYFAANAFGNLG